MAANLYPPGLTLHTIGYAALKYPELPEELLIPLSNQLGALQRMPLPVQTRIMPHIASQYLPALLTYQTSSAPHLHDPTSTQYYCSDTLTLINYLCSNPDVAIAVSKNPSLVQDTITKLLIPTIETDIRTARTLSNDANADVAPTSWEADLGNMLQFVSTILLRNEHLPTPLHPQIEELVTRLKAWKKKYSGKFIGRVCERLIRQIGNPENSEFVMVRESHNESLVCGWVGCEVRKGLDSCGRCKIQRYCCTEHQRKDWGFHKKICGKGLVDE